MPENLFEEIIMNLEISPILRLLGSLFLFLILYFIINRFTELARRGILKRARTKKERSNAQIFFQTGRYLLISILFILALLSYAGSFTGIGLTVGLLSAALGWALQRPITGLAAWIMVIVKRPFDIGDRIIIGTVRGDVVDVTLTHIHICEIGGTIASEESSGRIILIPNATLFETAIINYTKERDFILDQVIFAITYESNLEEAKRIAVDSAKEVLKEYKNKTIEPYTRVFFSGTALDVYIRFESPATERERITSEITQKIYKKISGSKEVKFNYPRSSVFLQKK